MLCDVGFTSAQAKKALSETVGTSWLLVETRLIESLIKDGNPERAVEWLFSHPDDTGEDAPTPSAPQGDRTGNSTKSLPGSTTLPARYKLKAFISHKGPSVHSGHYIAHIKMEDGWVLFNDEKVVKAEQKSVDDLKRFAYLFFFERVRGRA